METHRFKKRNKMQVKAFDERLLKVCRELLIVNPGTYFAICKKFKEDSTNKKLTEIGGIPVIMSSIPIKDLVIPSCFDLQRNNNLSLWSDDDGLIKLVYTNMTFTDGEVNGRKIKHLYADFDEIEKVRKVKAYKY